MPKFGKSGESKYIAVIADIVASRQISNRAEFQKDLQRVLRILNASMGKQHFAAPLTLTAGDEIQGLIRHPDAVIKLVVELSENVFPVRLVYGLGYGVLSTNLEPDVGLMDGPCFHRARSALEIARRGDSWVVAKGFDETLDLVLTTVFRLMDAIRSRWTEKQLHYVRESRRLLQKKVASKFQVSPSVISESLKAAYFHQLRDGEFALEKLLSEFGKKAEATSNSAKKPN